MGKKLIGKVANSFFTFPNYVKGRMQTTFFTQKNCRTEKLPRLPGLILHMRLVVRPNRDFFQFGKPGKPGKLGKPGKP